MNPSTSSYALPILIGLGLVGGAYVAHMAHEQLFVEGLEPQERRELLRVSGAAILAGAAIYLFRLDRKWILADEAAQAIWKKYAP